VAATAALAALAWAAVMAVGRTAAVAEVAFAEVTGVVAVAATAVEAVEAVATASAGASSLRVLRLHLDVGRRDALQRAARRPHAVLLEHRVGVPRCTSALMSSYSDFFSRITFHSRSPACAAASRLAPNASVKNSYRNVPKPPKVLSANG